MALQSEIATVEQPVYYQEITCLSDHDISVGFLVGKVMDVVHLALVNASSGASQCPIGISFPEYRDLGSKGADALVDDEEAGVERSVPIGSKIRLFSRQESDLQGLDLGTQLKRLSDYVHLTSIRQLRRKGVKYAVYKRCQPKSSKERLIRRQMKRQGLSETQASELYRDFRPRHSRLPYVNMKSHSSGERFRLYIERQYVDPSDQWGFSTYGLSSQVAVPEF
ncbi:MAG: type I-F CRISPR-associated endoribonuclease Cas6/Csy4 [Pirellulaceae bacterium]